MNCLTGQQTYDLERNFLAVIAVEYPQGEELPRFLLRKAHTHPDLSLLEGYYDILQR
jgi:hypothetical protein